MLFSGLKSSFRIFICDFPFLINIIPIITLTVCAITVARAGKEVILIERGLFSGSKNMFGGAIYTQPTKEIFPDFENTAPLERKIVKHNYLQFFQRNLNH